MSERTYPPMEAMARVWHHVWDAHTDEWVKDENGRELLRDAIPLSDFDAGILLDPESPLAPLMPALTARAVIGFFGTADALDQEAANVREAGHKLVGGHDPDVLNQPGVGALLGTGLNLAADYSEAAYISLEAEKVLARHGWKWDKKKGDATRKDVDSAPTTLLGKATATLDRDGMKDWVDMGGSREENPVEVRRAIAYCLRWFYPPEKLDTGSNGAIYRRIQYERKKAKELRQKK